MRLMWPVLLAVSAPIGGCGSTPTSSPPYSYEILSSIDSIAHTYRQLVPRVQDSTGFIETEKCDSLLMTSLLGASGVYIPDIEAAEVSPGKWLRKPPEAGSCYPVGSGSEISRDMLLGVIWYAWNTRNLGILERLHSYGEANNWVMGAGDPTRTGMRTLRGLLARAIYKLGGTYRPAEELLVDPQLAPKTGYEAHLQVLSILLTGELYGKIAQRHMLILKHQADTNPNSPLMQAAAARWVSTQYQARFEKAASNRQYFPADRLPTSADRCIEWATQEKNPADWKPCAEEQRTHSGGDLLFAIWVITHE